MSNLFKKKSKNAGPTELKMEVVAGGIGRFIARVQQRWADWMAKKSERMSVRAKWVMLTVFCLFTASSCIYLIGSSFHAVSISTPKVGRIKTPIHPAPRKQRSPAISGQDYRKLREYRLYMDSLARSPAGAPQYRKFRQQHPGLLDSIRIIEKMYQSQLNQ